jgi:hypothetical protein
MSKYFKQVKLLTDLGISYYDFGTIKEDNKKTHDFYQTDRITEKQKYELELKGVEVLTSFKEYAPELKSALICFPVKMKGV